jgi:D-alanyl-D-alanine endopeptidase (penicillin-binding protein 7)
MRPSTKRNLSVAALIAGLVAAGSYLPLASRHREAQPRDTTVAAVPTTPAPAPAAPAAQPEESAVPAAPPGAEVVPPEESETDRGPASATPAGPTLSYGRAAGLHLKPDPMRLNASAALVMDQETGEVLLRKNEQAVLPMASLTKLMTTLLVAEANQPMDEVLTITEADVDNERHSRSRLRVGTRLTREEALHLALMSSENRAAHALGRYYPGGLEKLVPAMNAKAHALGMKNTTYVDPTGLSNRNQSTAQDLALLVAAAGRNSMLRDFSTTPSHVASLGGRTMQYINSNRLVRNARAGWDIELQKTGYIVEAGRCLTMLTRVAGHNLIMVLLDAESNGTRIADAERMRRLVVAQNGWHDDIAVARAAATQEARKAKVAAAADRKERAEPRRKTVMAKAEKADKADKATAKSSAKGARATKARTTVAKAKGKEKESVAKSKGKEGERVRQTFAAGRSDQKS